METTGGIRVLHVNDKLSMDGENPSSVATLFAEWAPRLAQLGFRTSVATLRNPDPASTFLLDKGIPVHALGPGSYSWRNLSGLARVARDERVSILHLHGYAGSDFGRVVSRRLGVKCIVHEHAVLPVRVHQYLADRMLRNSMDAAVAVSEGVKKFMINGRSVPEELIRVIGNGVNIDRFSSATPDDAARVAGELGLEAGSNVIGTVTRLREEKGNADLIRAAATIRKEIPGLRVLIVGEGPLRRDLELLAQKVGVDDIVKFLGFRRDIPSILKVFDVHVIPSLTEGFPLSLIEAMAAGKAIVATAVGGMVDVGVDGETVIFIPPGVPGAMAAKTIATLKDVQLRARLAERASIAARSYGIERSAEELAGLYESLLHR